MPGIFDYCLFGQEINSSSLVTKSSIELIAEANEIVKNAIEYNGQGAWSIRFSIIQTK